MAPFIFKPLTPSHPFVKVSNVKAGPRDAESITCPGVRVITDYSWSIEALFNDILPKQLNKPPTKSILVTNAEELNGAIEECVDRRVCAFDFETTGLSAVNDELVSLQLASRPGFGYYIPFFHRDLTDGNGNKLLEHNFDPEVWLPIIHDRLIMNEDVVVIAHNLKFDIQWFYKYGLFGIKNQWDTMIAAHVINENLPSYSLKELSKSFIGYSQQTFGSLGIAKDPNNVKPGQYKDFSFLPLSKALPYACADVDMTLRLHTLWEPEIDKEYSKIFYDVEMPLVPVLARMEFKGVKLDVDYMNELNRPILDSIDALHIKLLEEVDNMRPGVMDEVLEEVNEGRYKKAKPNQTPQPKKNFVYQFNWESTSHLIRLFKKLGVNTGKTTPKGDKMSTGSKALIAMKRNPKHRGHKIAKMLLSLRKLTKLHEAFVASLPLKVNPKTGRIHASFNQARVATGRLSSSDPNLQQIPKKGVSVIRYAFVPSPGKVFVQCDYSQIELRILAHLSEDPGMLKVFREGGDIHSSTARECFAEIPNDMSDEDVAKNFPELRSNAKPINFGIVYGMTYKALAEQLGIPERTAKEYIDNYLAAKYKVKEYMVKRKLEMHSKGYVSTPLGRRRHIPKDTAGNRPFGWERKAINFPIQSASAEMLKYVMSKVTRLFEENNLPAELVLQIHDELIFEVEAQWAEEIKDLIKETFESGVEDLGYTYSIPLTAEPTVQMRWGMPAVQCAKCGTYTFICRGKKDYICTKCEGIEYPGMWNLEATLEEIDNSF